MDLEKTFLRRLFLTLVCWLIARLRVAVGLPAYPEWVVKAAQDEERRRRKAYLQCRGCGKTLVMAVRELQEIDDFTHYGCPSYEWADEDDYDEEAELTA